MRDELAQIFRTDKGPNYDRADIYLKVSTRTLLNDIRADEGMFGEEVWSACEALRIRGEETELSKWLLSDRKEPAPGVTNSSEKGI